MNRARWTYLAQLTQALQNEGVEGRRAGEFVAEIDSHLAETDADPVAEFGTPHQLASELSRRPGALRPGWLPPIWWVWLLGGLAAVFGGAIIDAVMLGTLQGRIPIQAKGVVWVGLLYAGIIGIRYIAIRRLDGITWSGLGGRVILLAMGVGIVVTTLSERLDAGVLMEVPAMVFWVGAAVVLGLLVGLLVRSNNPVRFPDHAAHLKRLRRGPFAGPPPTDGPSFEASARG